jgi:glutamate synthase (NADPH/NADH) large chain
MLLIDLEEGRIVSDEDLKEELATKYPYREWLDRTQVIAQGHAGCQARSAEDQRVPARPPAGLWLHPGRPQVPAVADGTDRTGSHRLDGHRYAVSALSSQPKLLHTYFKQNFAQVTNPPIDPIREELVMSWCRSSARAPTCSTWGHLAPEAA